jgi:hypothetical protein
MKKLKKKQKTILLYTAIAIGLILLGGFFIWYQGRSEKAGVKTQVENFGLTLKLVSLSAPKEVAAQDIRQQYAQFLTPELLDEWVNNPQVALGRLVSSPWPERIDIDSLNKTAEGQYAVSGKIIEMTSVEKEKGGAADVRQIELVLEKTDGKWLIAEATMGTYQ